MFCQKHRFNCLKNNVFKRLSSFYLMSSNFYNLNLFAKVPNIYANVNHKKKVEHIGVHTIIAYTYMYTNFILCT